VSGSKPLHGGPSGHNGPGSPIFYMFFDIEQNDFKEEQQWKGNQR